MRGSFAPDPARNPSDTVSATTYLWNGNSSQTRAQITHSSSYERSGISPLCCMSSMLSRRSPLRIARMKFSVSRLYFEGPKSFHCILFKLMTMCTVLIYQRYLYKTYPHVGYIGVAVFVESRLSFRNRAIRYVIYANFSPQKHVLTEAIKQHESSLASAHLLPPWHPQQ